MTLSKQNTSYCKTEIQFKLVNFSDSQSMSIIVRHMLFYKLTDQVWNQAWDHSVNRGFQ